MLRTGIQLDRFRKRHPMFGDSEPGTLYGYFSVLTKTGLVDVISSGTKRDGKKAIDLWEHVSVSTKTRCPTWDEMCQVKSLFWHQNECVIQFHPAEKDYVNKHPFCLHMWKLIAGRFPLPPKEAL